MFLKIPWMGFKISLLILSMQATEQETWPSCVKTTITVLLKSQDPRLESESVKLEYEHKDPERELGAAEKSSSNPFPVIP